RRSDGLFLRLVEGLGHLAAEVPHHRAAGGGPLEPNEAPLRAQEELRSFGERSESLWLAAALRHGPHRASVPVDDAVSEEGGSGSERKGPAGGRLPCREADEMGGGEQHEGVVVERESRVVGGLGPLEERLGAHFACYLA